MLLVISLCFRCSRSSARKRCSMACSNVCFQQTSDPKIRKSKESISETTNTVSKRWPTSSHSNSSSIGRTTRSMSKPRFNKCFLNQVKATQTKVNLSVLIPFIVETSISDCKLIVLIKNMKHLLPKIFGFQKIGFLMHNSK